jgi:hypothetical protein
VEGGSTGRYGTVCGSGMVGGETFVCDYMIHGQYRYVHVQYLAVPSLMGRTDVGTYERASERASDKMTIDKLAQTVELR